MHLTHPLTSVPMKGPLLLQLQWCRLGGGAAQPSNKVVHPLVVMLPWVWAEPLHVGKYVELCHQNGWDVLVVRWPMLALWAPQPLSRALAGTLLSALGAELTLRGERPLVFWSFSGAAKGVYSSLLSLLAAPQQLKPAARVAAAQVLRCCVGQVYDSGPVDFTSDMGRRLLSPTATASTSSSATPPAHATALVATAAALGAAARNAAVNVGAGALDFCLLEHFDREAAAMWTALKHPPVGGPVLLLYSRSDPLADAAQIAGLAAALRGQGRAVLETVWHDTPHVGHLRADPQAYTDSASYLLSQALQAWGARSSRRREGQQWAAGWQQEQQHKQPGGLRDSSTRTSTSSSSTVCSNYGSSSSSFAAQAHQEPQLAMQPCSSSSRRSGYLQQQQQLVMQPTRGVSCTGRVKATRSHQQSSSSSSVPPPLAAAALTRCSTSGTTSTAAASATSASAQATGAALMQQLTRAPLLPQQQEAGVGAAACHVGMRQQWGGSAAAAPGARPPAAVRISSWPATATAVAAAMASDSGGEPVCADSALLSHSLRCLASSFAATHLHLHGGRQDRDADGGGGGATRLASVPGPPEQPQQQQPFIQRVVSRIRSRL